MNKLLTLSLCSLLAGCGSAYPYPQYPYVQAAAENACEPYTGLIRASASSVVLKGIRDFYAVCKDGTRIYSTAEEM